MLVWKKKLAYAACKSLKTSASSSTTQDCQSLWPMDMAPRIGTETRRPEEPSCLYSILVASKLACSSLGMSPIVSDCAGLMGLVERLVFGRRAILAVYGGSEDQWLKELGRRGI